MPPDRSVLGRAAARTRNSTAFCRASPNWRVDAPRLRVSAAHTRTEDGSRPAARTMRLPAGRSCTPTNADRPPSPAWLGVMSRVASQPDSAVPPPSPVRTRELVHHATCEPVRVQ
ncbi:hypothetical protein GCM10022221_50210 [Actinocorallia aurea]